jgi:hypothetical protein
LSESTERQGSATGNVRSLTDAIRKVRLAETERTDVVVELREAERARLDMLADELRGVFSEIPAENDQFIFQVVPGNQPRLWIDMTSFAVLGRDRRTYRFLKDTRLGRTVILESPNLDDMADCITNYVAERIIERERALEADWLVKRIGKEGETPWKERAPIPELPAPRSGSASQNIGWVASAFLLGLLLGIVGLLAYAWVRVPGA